MAVTTKATSETLFDKQCRFNGGFWDGFAGAWDTRSLSGHFDSIYAAGAEAGRQAHRDGDTTESSAPYWRVYARTARV